MKTITEYSREWADQLMATPKAELAELFGLAPHPKERKRSYIARLRAHSIAQDFNYSYPVGSTVHYATEPGPGALFIPFTVEQPAYALGIVTVATFKELSGPRPINPEQILGFEGVYFARLISAKKAEPGKG